MCIWTQTLPWSCYVRMGYVVLIDSVWEVKRDAILWNKPNECCRCIVTRFRIDYIINCDILRYRDVKIWRHLGINRISKAIFSWLSWFLISLFSWLHVQRRVDSITSYHVSIKWPSSWLDHGYLEQQWNWKSHTHVTCIFNFQIN